ncbi:MULTISPECIES: tripartite tricarboxylate transporter substrate binding protein [unclassified Rhizobium]|uniref:Bug family tripartite tricarboxylate transporter substrate binding protein n=1 Tax=unclassified Rhizobium TaxID=2613769 RepID=UPI001A9A280D|nr:MULTISPECIES: tripartite tricarboxylate transporter substrate binding protein [unclassified Rhizobium]MBX5164038.1 tripartite tricarboxylate transporter substrate binding protein [Rhizobium sp. NZLR4b]MBX5171499.1 tripartite tricarboxylate transporter substrate binding protein [Rhizobium sp. NZLR1b]MBX5183563.1 tripartite tricarboxylate transporter substrate binding protein [Rhizobium sp. NZLR5]MBX5192151.1 tripartite tricarboxylate transporter substrate binding protein [Rhizobium sp. NZLR3b
MAPFDMTRRAGLALGFGVLAALAAGTSAAAADFPDRAITMVVPFAAGGSTDVVARIVAQKMSEDLGQQVIVQNVAGAGGNLGADNVARAEPDGYTILMGTVATHALNPLILKSTPYDPEKDFAPVSLLVVVPNVLVVNPELPAKTVQGLVALLKAEPDKYSYASSGNGTPLHLSGELFKAMAGVSMQHIPYKGAGPALNDVIGNQVPIMFDNLPSSSSHIKAGTLRALAVTTAERAPSFPDVPTIAESGIAGYETYTWNALFAPAKTPSEVVMRLNASANKALKDPAVAERMKEFSATIVGSTPEQLGAHVKAELAKWGPVVKGANIQME